VRSGSSASGALQPGARHGVPVVTGVADVFTTAARAASSSTGSGDVRHALMPIMGAEALICYRFDDGEHARRRRAGTGAISSADVLELLLGLPIAASVPLASLTCRERGVGSGFTRRGLSLRRPGDAACGGARDCRTCSCRGVELAGRAGGGGTVRAEVVAAEHRRAGPRRARIRPAPRRRADLPGRRRAQGPGRRG